MPPIEELKAVAQETEGIPDYALRAWIREFGVEIVLNVLPTARAAWEMERPKSSKSLQPIPLAIYLRNQMRYEKQYPLPAPEKRGLDLRFLEEK
jgi:hypothetical protein